MSKAQNLLFLLSLVVLICFIALGFYFQNQKLNLAKKIENINKEIAASQIKTEVEKELIISSERIRGFSKILEAHKIPSKFFEFLKTNCHQKVKISGMQLDDLAYHAVISGEAASFEALSEQVLILKSSKNVNNLQVSNVFLNREGKVEFNLNFDFPKELIQI